MKSAFKINVNNISSIELEIKGEKASDFYVSFGDSEVKHKREGKEFIENKIIITMNNGNNYCKCFDTIDELIAFELEILDRQKNNKLFIEI